MVFSSAEFLALFLPCVLLVYYNPFFRGRRFRNVFLLLVSLFFYAWGEPVYVLLLMLSIAVNWWFGLQVEKDSPHRRGLLAAAVVFNLAGLFVFKYLGFVCENLAVLGLAVPRVELALPIGISFYTFQAMSYVIDVYRKKSPAQRSVLDVGLYVSFFPQLIAGPIVRYETVALEIHGRKETWEDFCEGVPRFVCGLGKKAILANNMALVADAAFQSGNLSAPMAWLGAVAYALQIYFDFSGYSDMAIGLGRMFGFHFLENFNRPYLASSITDFWRRWHISLSSWFRDYLYIPLGGSRRGSGRKYCNILIVFAVSGLWHGAGLTFLVWGLLNGAYQAAGGLTAGLRSRCRQALGLRDDSPVTRWWQMLVTFLLSTLAWVFFKAASLSSALAVLRGMVSGPLLVRPILANTGLDRGECLVALLCLAALLAVDLLSLRRRVCERFLTLPRPLRWVLVLALLLTVAVFGVYGTGYDAQDFIYFKF